MAGAVTAIGLGTSLALAQVAAWSRPGALLDVDFAGDRYMFAGRNYPDRSAFLAAIDATEAGGAITTNPKLAGPELLADPGFDTGIAGWVNGETLESVGVLSYDSASKRLHVNVAARGSTSTLFRCSIPVAVTVGKAYRFQLRSAQAFGVGAGNTGFNPFNSFGGKDGGIGVAHAAGELISDYSAASANPMYLGAHTNGTIVDEYWDDQSVREIVPLVGHNYLALSGIVVGTTPAEASGNRVVFQADTNDERDRVRLVWDSSKHLRLIVTNNDAEQANLDLGVVEVSTAFEVAFSSATSSFKARLNGAAIVSGSSGSHPGLSHIRIGRSFTGEAWTGTVQRVTLFPDAGSPPTLEQ